MSQENVSTSDVNDYLDTKFNHSFQKFLSNFYSLLLLTLNYTWNIFPESCKNNYFNKILFPDEAIDEFSWSSFILPFHLETWFSILAFVFGTSTCLWIFHKHPKGFTTVDFLEAITISTSSIIGLGIRDANDLSTTKSARLTMFVVFICGSLFFYVYGAFLTSALAVPKIYTPFNTPEEILSTNYK